VTGSTPAVWVLPGGVTLGRHDLVIIEEKDYRYGRGVVRLQVEHVGDRDGNVPAGADWVTVIGHEVDVYGDVTGPGRQVSARVSALRPLRRLPPSRAVT
jgi:hypothetical protein